MSKYKKLEEYIGFKFNDWLVIDIGEKSKYDKKLICKCECGYCNNIIKEVSFYDLIYNESKNCGYKRNKKYNSFNLEGKFGIGYTRKGEEFYFDLEDYDLIKNYCWRTNNTGYLTTTIKRKNILMHRFLMNVVNESKIIIDHENHNITDNRKLNLRKCTSSNNNCNKELLIRNNSGVSGVYYHKHAKKWCANIGKDYKNYYLGIYENIEDAIKARLLSEKELFGEFAPQKHLFEQYGIN